MSRVLSITDTYASFFWGCAKFAVSPYTETFMAIARGGNDEEEALNHVVAASVVCSILTFVVPVLPMLTSITLFLAQIGILLGVASMLMTYPIALAIDICSPDGFDNRNTHCHSFA